MNQTFEGWESVAHRLRKKADDQEQIARDRDESATRLNRGQRDSLRAIASRIVKNGVVIADEVGMGKTRIAVELTRCVIESGGRVAILVPPGLGYQWHAELCDGGLMDVPHILRSIDGYLRVWATEETDQQEPWFSESVVLISHAFTNWRFGANSHNWRWGLLPELYSRWRKRIDERLPRGYREHEQSISLWPYLAAQSIVDAIPFGQHPAADILTQLLNEVSWPRPCEAAAYSKHGELRIWLERGVGVGLGVFDLVVIDEAHKSRGAESGLSRLLEQVVLTTTAARRLALTATPVELNVSQWNHTLGRLDLPESTRESARKVIDEYAASVKRVQQTWRSNPESRNAYKLAASEFQTTLSPYLIRRDKREDPDVIRFCEHTKRPINEYRRESEILIKPSDLSSAWQEAICAAESLSVVTRQAADPVAKRLRLTLGNGHGIAALLDQTKRDKEDSQQEAFSQADRGAERQESLIDDLTGDAGEAKRQARATWWLGAIQRAFGPNDDSLFDHPAIRAAVEAIELETEQGGKVLVFGRFTRPLRALVELLNAREMLRRVEKKEPWPQSRVHQDSDGSEWPAVHAAHRQMNSSIQLEALDDTLKMQYDRRRRDRDRFRDALVSRLEQGFERNPLGTHIASLFAAFKRSVGTQTHGDNSDEHILTVVARAMLELLETPEAETTECATAFCQLIEASSDREVAQVDGDEESDSDDVGEHWSVIEGRLREEYTRTRGAFARLMFGGTSSESRRMIQLAFNRPESFPKVLVAQSLVGREGLNLHRACRVVVLLHPEWNPGVVEQQIGRVDRVNSRWCHELRNAINAGLPDNEIPRIEIRPVIFRGTYDEHHWKVLRDRWDELRAQLHGVVIPSRTAHAESEYATLLEEILSAAPDFRPRS